MAQAECTGDFYVEEIDRTECIGNSLSKINSNFYNLDVAVCELENNLSKLEDDLTAVDVDLQAQIDALKFRTGGVETTINSFLGRDLFLSVDTRGMTKTGNSAGSIAAFLNVLAPVTNYLAGTKLRILSTQQNVSTSAYLERRNHIGSSYVAGVSVSTSILNPTRSFLLYRVNTAVTSWEYVSG